MTIAGISDIFTKAVDDERFVVSVSHREKVRLTEAEYLASRWALNEGAEMPDEPTTDPVEDQSGEPKQERNFDAMFSDHRKRTVRDVNSALDQRMGNFVTKDDFETFTSTLFDRLPGSQPEPQPGENDQKPKKGEKHETPKDVQMQKLTQRLEAQDAQLQKLQDDLKSKDEAAVKTDDFRFIEEQMLTSGVDAKLAKQARLLFLADHEIIHDDEKGRVHEIKGEFGPEFKESKTLIPDWLESNAHFLAAKKQGSGAGGQGGNPRVSRPVDISKLAADPDEYMKHREEIHKKLEGR